MRLILICHGATAATRAAAFARDEPLEDAARRRAEALGRGVGRADRALSGPALRCRQTAEALGLAAEVEPALRDLDCGRWAGLDLAAVGQAEPEALAAWLGDPGSAPHGGESLGALVMRVGSWLDSLGGGRRVVAVTHPAVVRAALLHVLAAPWDGFWRIDAEPLSRTRIERRAGRWRLRLPSD